VAIGSQGAFKKWRNPYNADDFLQLRNSNDLLLGGIDSNGVFYGSLSGGIHTDSTLTGTGTVASPLSVSPSIGTTVFVGTPTGSCTATQTAVNTSTGAFYSCSGGSWVLVASTSGSLVSPVSSPNPLAFDVNVAFKGPNPYIDATRFGVRAVSPTVAPAIPGITVNCTSGSPNVTISAASTFQNGDGVALYGCGAGTIGVPSAPTVTASLAAAQTGLNLDVPGPTGATTYCYQLVARSLMGATNVSSETCTTTGPASLGLQTNTITTVTLSNTTATYVTSAPHGLVAGAHVVITGVTTNTSGGQVTNFNATTNPFVGWFVIATVPDNTHFTITLLTDSRNGAITVGTGGTVNYWNCIRISATELTGNFQYYVYGRVSGGTKTLIGTMWPQTPGLSGDPTYLAFDDFGSPVTTFPHHPSYIPTTVPVVATNEMLATTIISGAGTTSLVLANNAGNTISGQTILFDDAVTFLAAATYAANLAGGTDGPLMLPEPGNGLSYVFNSPISLGTGATSRITVLQKGQVWINEPISLTSVSWYGQATSNMPIASFAFSGAPQIVVSNASPGFYALNNVYLKDLVFAVNSSGGTNGTTLYIQENGGIPVSGTFDNVGFGLGTSTAYSNMAMLLRGTAGFYFSKTLLLGTQNGNLIGTTPGIFFNLAGNVVFDLLNLSGCGIASRVNAAGGFMKVDAVYSQGNYQPYFSLVNSGSQHFLDVRNALFDTTEVPLLANYGGAVVSLEVNNSITGASMLTGSGASRTSVTMQGTSVGIPTQNIGTAQLNQAYTVIDGTLGQTSIGMDIYNRSMSLGPAYSLFTTTSPYVAPTCPVSAGGSVPVGTFTYSFAPIFANGSQGVYSYLCTATTTNGNQTVTVGWTAVPGAVQYNVFRNGVALTASPVTGTSFSDTLANPGGNPGPNQAAGGPAGIRGSLIWSQQNQIGDRAIVQAGSGSPSAGLCTTSKGGSLYLRTDGTTITTLYVCDGTSGVWTAK